MLRHFGKLVTLLEGASGFFGCSLGELVTDLDWGLVFSAAVRGTSYRFGEGVWISGTNWAI